RLADLITRAIGEVTEDGWVFRVDLRLRPEGTRGNLANSLRSAEIYYESWGQTWERAAFLKARPVAGDWKLGQRFLEMIEPFVYRKYLDYTTVEEFREMKREIDRQAVRQEAVNPWIHDFKTQCKDVKLGRGGIREIEFFVQTLQLIHGGKDYGVREGNTLRALEKLCKHGHIQSEEWQNLQVAYTFLRQVEHKLQIVQARQTHRLPADLQGIRELALRLGLRDSSEEAAPALFLKKLEGHCQKVQDLYGQLFYQPGEDIGQHIRWEIADLLRDDIAEDEILFHLSVYGFRDPKTARHHLTLLREGPPYVHFSSKGQRLLKKIAPLMLTEVISSSDPDAALSNLEGFLSAVGGRTTFLSLLAENPSVIRLLVRLFGGSDYLAGQFRRSPELLDSLVRSDQTQPHRTRTALYGELNRLMEEATDYEEALDILRQFRNAELLRIGMNDLYGALNHSQRSTQVTRLADTCLQQAYEISRTEMRTKYGRPCWRDQDGKLRKSQ
ncbi:MAG: putative nucleotidyltransferase substrate binding domain-containing protein, partial [Candidatus Binatia bacterium]|nr:putative nucleotidyltransferase substrate binding domain-containing protein [Candidatus Binatia bacterium]